MNKNYLIKVDDIYGISRRIREINKNYTLFLNVKTKKYEIHDESNHINSLCLTLLPHELNSSVIRRLHISKRENMKKLFIEVEENNKKLEEKNKQKILSHASDVMSSILSYSSHKSGELDNKTVREIVEKVEEE